MLALTFVRLAILQTALVAIAQARTCYFTNGQPADSTFQPCFPDQADSACCSLAKPNDVPNAICLTGGFCYNQDPYYRGILRQGACTDATWKSLDCPSLSNTAFDHGLIVMPCPLQGRGFWCASNGTYCCDEAVRHDLGHLMNVTVTSYSGTVASYPGASSTSGPAISTSPSQATSTATCTPISNPSSPQTNKTAAGVGGALGACFLIALGGLFAQRRRYDSQMREKDAMIRSLATGMPLPHINREVNAEKRARRPPVELESYGMAHEAEGGRTTEFGSTATTSWS